MKERKKTDADALRGRPVGAPRDENGRYLRKADPWDFKGPYNFAPLRMNKPATQK